MFRLLHLVLPSRLSHWRRLLLAGIVLLGMTFWISWSIHVPHKILMPEELLDAPTWDRAMDMNPRPQFDGNWREYHAKSMHGLQVNQLKIGSNSHVYFDKAIVPNRPEQWSVHAKVVYYVWCQTHYRNTASMKYFEFRHFLTIRSIVQFLNPDVIYLYYNQLPKRDKSSYLTWFEELGEDFPFLVRQHINDSGMCDNYGRVPLHFIVNNLTRPGSIYVAENTLFSVRPDHTPIDGVVNMLDFKRQSGYLAVGNRATRPAWLPVSEARCVTTQQFNSGNNDTCIYFAPTKRKIPADSANILRPDMIWHGSSPFKRLCRWLMYGQEQLPTPNLNPEPVIPHIAHYVWFGGGEMDYLFYLSVLSCLHILNLDMVYIHGDLPPSGPHWNIIANKSRVQWVYRPRIRMVYEQQLDRIEHEADITAVHAVLKYGGLHVDPDLLFWQQFPEEYWHYDSVAAPNRNFARFYPFYINIGLFLARPGATFWRMVELGERSFLQEEWNWNSARLLLKIYERNPHLLKVCPHLQVMCAGIKTNECWPHWPSATDPSAWASNVSEWINMSYSYHLNTPTPPELFSLQNNLNSDTVFAKMGKNILRSAGLL